MRCYAYHLFTPKNNSLWGRLGQVAMKRLVSKRRASPIVFFLAAVIALSCVMMVVIGGEQVATDIRTGEGLGISPLCPAIKHAH